MMFGDDISDFFHTDNKLRSLALSSSREKSDALLAPYHQRQNGPLSIIPGHTFLYHSLQYICDQVDISRTDTGLAAL